LKIALIGVDGQLGTDINSYFCRKGLEVVGLVGLKEIDITDPVKCNSTLRDINPDLIINTAAFLNVDLCEDEIMSAFKVNVEGIKNLSKICVGMNIPLMHFSTDYIFDGSKNEPYTEEDCARPLSIYGMSKLGGEKVIQYMLEKYYIIRLCGLYGYTCSVGKGNVNFVETMIKLGKEKKKLKVIDDQVCTPTSTKDVAEKLFKLAQTEQYGIYHMTNTGSCSWYGFACEIFKLMDMSVDISPTSSEEFGAKAIRPAYSVLDNLYLRKAGVTDMRDWKEALKDYIGNRK